MPGFGGLQALADARGARVDLPCIVISGTPNEEAAVEALRAGALDFLSKDSRCGSCRQSSARCAKRRNGVRESAERELRLSARSAIARRSSSHPRRCITYDLTRSRVARGERKRRCGCSGARSSSAARERARWPVPRRGSSNGGMSVEAAPRDHRARATPGTMCPRRVGVRRRRTATVIPIESRLARMPSIGTPSCCASAILDQRERLRHRRRFAAAPTELELQNRRIQEANRLKSEFLANMSHELRTPLNAIIGFAELMHDGQVDPDSPQHKEYLGDILTSGRHLLQLINDVLDLAKVESGKLEFRPEPVDLGKLVGEVSRHPARTAPSKRIKVETERRSELSDVVHRSEPLKQVLYNYLSNAIKFTPEGGRVTVRACVRGADAVPARGRGHRHRHRARGSRPAVRRVPAARRRRGEAPPGHRLGLALTDGSSRRRAARSACARRRARAACSTRRCRATSAAREAPVLHAHDHAAPRSVRARCSSSRTTPRDRAGHRRRAQRRRATRVEIAATAPRRSRAAASASFDAVTLDLLLPDMSGLDLLAALRGESRACGDAGDRRDGVADAKLVAGFAVHDVLRKPLEPQSLLAALERAGVRPDAAAASSSSTTIRVRCA